MPAGSGAPATWTVADPAPGVAVAEVVLDVPVPRVFSYAVPGTWSGHLAPGQRVEVPFRGRPRPGLVVAVSTGPAPSRALDTLETPLDGVPALPEPLLAVGSWVAEQTVSAWGQVLARALPPGAGRGLAPESLPPPGPQAPRVPAVLITGGNRASAVTAAVVAARGRGEGSLVLAADIASARAWRVRLAEALGEPVAILTSAEAPSARWRTWWAVRQGEPAVAVGTRGAAFLPVARLGLLVVVDEEEVAHRSPEAPRWHAREVAGRRAEVEGGHLLLTSAAPSLETWVRIGAGEIARRDAPEPAWPATHRLDLRGQDPGVCLLPPLREAVRETLGAGRPSLLLLNQLGWGRLLRCGECGAVRRCRSCRLALVYHRETRSLCCGLCGGRIPAGSLCGRCRGRRLVPLGWGTERLEAEARTAFPGARIVRHDGTLSPARSREIRAAVRRGDVDVLVGTRGALGLLGPGQVGLAALVLADTMLGRPDFRAAERTFQLVCRLGELVEPPGSLWLQSFFPDHPALTSSEPGLRERFYRAEAAERETLGYPPARRLALLVAEGPGAARQVADLVARSRDTGVDVLGPARLPGDRWQAVLLGGTDLPHRVAEVVAPLRGRRRLGDTRLIVDVDPVELP